MHLARFINGGYCLHKVSGEWKGVCSCWFDKDGKLLDAEQIFEPFGRTRKVKRDGPMWRQLQTVGNRYKHIPAN